MKSRPEPHRCPVCGYPGLAESPRSISGGGSYEICPSCGYQFGVDDDDLEVPYLVHRDRWVSGGMHWFSQGIRPPENWDPQAQLARVADQR